jgi:hypothetical protein
MVARKAAMKHKKIGGLIVSILTVVLVIACASLESGYAPPPRHPEEDGEDLRNCLDCHETDEEEIPYDKFVHGMFFSDNHRQVAGRYGSVCTTCHRESFCSECHGVGIELKPSIKNQTENHRRMPHRGDYLTRHIIDGRVNPTSCYRCHGNPKSAQTCRPCHG